jgi:Asp-tRNA(Asn)/Glu-tRNA(Gln) amidotransferase C subunit
MTKTQLFVRDLRSKRSEISKLQGDLEDMLDHVAVLEARAKNGGKPTLTPAQVRARLSVKN